MIQRRQDPGSWKQCLWVTGAIHLTSWRNPWSMSPPIAMKNIWSLLNVTVFKFSAGLEHHHQLLWYTTLYRMLEKHKGTFSVREHKMASWGSHVMLCINDLSDETCWNLLPLLLCWLLNQKPGVLDYFGWCTWDAFYFDVNPQGIEDGLKR